MNAASNSEALIKEMRDAHPSTRWLVYQRLVATYGEGFAKTVQAQVERSEEKRKGGKRE